MKYSRIQGISDNTECEAAQTWVNAWKGQASPLVSEESECVMESWLVGCRFKSNCPLVGPDTIGTESWLVGCRFQSNCPLVGPDTIGTESGTRYVVSSSSARLWSLEYQSRSLTLHGGLKIEMSCLWKTLKVASRPSAKTHFVARRKSAKYHSIQLI